MSLCSCGHEAGRHELITNGKDYRQFCSAEDCPCPAFKPVAQEVVPTDLEPLTPAQVIFAMLEEAMRRNDNPECQAEFGFNGTQMFHHVALEQRINDYITRLSQPPPQQVELEEILTRYHASFSCDNINCATEQHRQCVIDAKAALIAWARKGR